MRVIVTGANGFVARNLRFRLAELGRADIIPVTRSTSDDELRSAASTGDFVFHLAGVNRPTDPAEFGRGNRDFTERLCEHLAAAGRPIPIVYASSRQATADNVYGRSKLAGEAIVERYGRESGAPFYIFRLPNVFGKWSRPNYNSAVATFSYNIARRLPITVHDPSAPLSLVYVDDVVDAMVGLLDTRGQAVGHRDVEPEYRTTVGEVAAMIEGFRGGRETLAVPPAGGGLVRALYATYMSFLPPSDFAYDVRCHADARGVFVEMLKMPAFGQVSYFTAGPGVTRGGHYHHTKTEKFLVVKGSARFGFRNVDTNDAYELFVNGSTPRIVETVPGWAHDVTNVGTDEMVVMLWANEVFDPQRPDTIRYEIAR